MRDFWRGAGERRRVRVSASPARPTSTSDDGRTPFASINFVTAHDGFTLRDLVSYNDKHNEANVEDNRDGTDDNRSWNCGVEGPTDDPAVNALRARQQRNFLATLLLSQGVPMLLGGDELGRTQRRQQQRVVPGQRDLVVRLGRAPTRELLEFTRRLIALRREHPVFRRTTFLAGEARRARAARRLVVPARRPPDDADATGRAPRRATLGVFLNGDEIRDAHAARRARSSTTRSCSLFNAHFEPVDVHAADAALRRALAGRALDGRRRRDGPLGARRACSRAGARARRAPAAPSP